MNSLPSPHRLAHLVVASLVLAVPATAHDFWIEPSELRPAKGTRVAIELLVGERLAGEKLARNPAKIAQFFAVGPGSRVDLLGIEGKTPAGYLRADDPGRVTIGYRSNPSTIELEAAKFEAYLAEEGLEHVIELRRQRGESARPGRETYSRCAKSLLDVARSPDGAGFDRRLGFPLEIVPLRDPYESAPDDELTFVVEFQLEPLANALVGCRRSAAPDHEVRVRTDAAGKVTFARAGDGFHLVRVVHMVEAPSGIAQDWQSLWASFTFALDASAPIEKR